MAWLLLHQARKRSWPSFISQPQSTCSEGERQSIEKSNNINMGEETGKLIMPDFLSSWRDSHTIKINDRRLTIRVVRNVCVRCRIIFWLVFMAIICFAALKTLIMLSPKKFPNFFLDILNILNNFSFSFELQLHPFCYSASPA